MPSGSRSHNTRLLFQGPFNPLPMSPLNHTLHLFHITADLQGYRRKVVKKAIADRPDPDRISAHYVERQNLTMCMSMRCFTRLTNPFSKNVANHALSFALQ